MSDLTDKLDKIFGDYDFVNDQDRGAQLLPEFLKNSENVKKIINAIMPEIQELHDAQKEVFSKINIFEAVGSQLDNIFGEILDLERLSGQDDEDYRLDLLAQSSKLAQSGEISVMKALYKSLTSASSVSLQEFQPAAFKMDAIVAVLPSIAQLEKLRNTLSSAKQGGNNMALTITTSENPLRLKNLTSPNPLSPTGLSGDGFTGGTLVQGF
jgi:hypothetical protein